jgi:hypothetical protein
MTRLLLTAAILAAAAPAFACDMENRFRPTLNRVPLRHSRPMIRQLRPQSARADSKSHEQGVTVFCRRQLRTRRRQLAC